MLFSKIIQKILLINFALVICTIWPADKLKNHHFFGAWKIDVHMMQEDLEKKKKKKLTDMEMQVWNSTKKFLSSIELEISRDYIKRKVGKKLSKESYKVIKSKTPKDYILLKLKDKMNPRTLKPLNKDFTKIEYSVLNNKGKITEKLFLLRK